MTDHPDRRGVMQRALLAAAATALPRTTATAQETTAMAHDPSHDFDFFFGKWKVRHRYLKERLAGSTEWIEFTGTCEARPIMGGMGNMDDNVIEKPTGTYRAATFRAYDPVSKTWAIWWLDGRMPHNPVDPPMIGSFIDGVGTFLADDVQNGKPVKVRFLWSHITPTSCRWEQSLSPDGGKTWEVNWVMENMRAA